MAPLPEEKSTFTTLLTSILKRIPSAIPDPSPLSPLLPRQDHILKREVDPSVGVTPFNTIPNKAVFAIFGLLGAGFVLTGIWFFFHAKNGGFYFHENDWEDYKSTVLRRKGPNGTTLSGATESTDLGGGSVVHGEEEKSVWGRITRKGRKGKKEKRYKDFEDDGTTEYLGSGGGSSLGSEMSEVRKEKRRVHKEAKQSKPKKSRFHRNRNAPTEASEAETLTVADPDEEVDIGVQDTIRAYRHEKPARVGGLNKPADGSSWDGSNTEASSDLMSHREPTPTNTPTKPRERKERNDKYTGGNGGIRKVVSTSHHNSGAVVAPGGGSTFWTRSSAPSETATSSSRTTTSEDEERERIRAEARRLQEKGRAASSHANSSGRRDFSFQHGDDNSTVVSATTTTSEDREREARREARRERRREGGGSRSPTKKEMPGNFYEESEVSGLSGSTVSGKSGDTGTKSYHHPIPGLSVNHGSSGAGADEYKEERRKRRAAGGGGGGYRRGRRDSLE